MLTHTNPVVAEEIVRTLRWERRLVRRLLVAAAPASDTDHVTRVSFLLSAPGHPCPEDFGWLAWFTKRFDTFPIVLEALRVNRPASAELDALAAGRLDRSAAWAAYQEVLQNSSAGRCVGLVVRFRRGSGVGEVVLHDAGFAVDDSRPHLRLPRGRFLQAFGAFTTQVGPHLAGLL